MSTAHYSGSDPESGCAFMALSASLVVLIVVVLLVAVVWR